MGEAIFPAASAAYYTTGPSYGIHQTVSALNNLGSRVPLITPESPEIALSSRGTIVPVISGRRKVGAVTGWVGARAVIKEGGGAGKGSGSRTAGRVNIWHEVGWHMLCVGPAYRLNAIYRAGRIIYNTPINRDTTPSGSQIVVGGVEGFRIYWGEPDQDVDEQLPTFTGVGSNWPYVCYVLWTVARLGPNPTWPVFEYDIEVRPEDLPDGFAPEAAANYDDSLAYAFTGGVNVAHTIAQLLFGAYPHGIGMPESVVDLDTLEDVACCMSSSVLASSVITKARTAAETLAQIFEDFGIRMPWNPVTGKYEFVYLKAAADDATIPEIPYTAQTGKLPEVVTPHLPQTGTSAVFRFADQEHGYNPTTVAVGDDGRADLATIQNSQQVSLETTVDFGTAVEIAERRGQEVIAQPTEVTFEFNREAAYYLIPGRIFTVEGRSGYYRVVASEVDLEAGLARITAIDDVYGVTESEYAPDSTGNTPDDAGDPPDADETQQAIIELPAYLLGGAQTQAVVLPRIREDTSIIASTPHFSEDNTTYLEQDTRTEANTGGTLLDAIAADDPYYIAQGPTFTLQGPDAAEALDLSSDLSQWAQGRQWAVIGDEIFFVQKITAVSGSTYRLDGLMRARYDTSRAAHSVGAAVLVFDATDISVYSSFLLGVNKTLYVKNQPSNGNPRDLSDISAISKTLYGKGIRPMPVKALRVDQGRNAYTTGQDVSIVWDYQSALVSGTGAGLQPAGQATGDAPVDGFFRVRIRETDDTLVKTVDGLTEPTYLYDNAVLQTDLGGETDFKVQVTNYKAGYESPVLEITVTAE